MKTIVSTADAIPSLPFFSQAAISRGYVYVSGNIGCTKDYKLVEGGVQAQTVSNLAKFKSINTPIFCMDCSVQLYRICLVYFKLRDPR